MSWLHGLTVLAAASIGAATAQAPPPIDPATAESIAVKTQDDRVTVPVTIKGQGPFRFIVDTGAQATVVSNTLAERLGLTIRRPGVLIGMASRQDILTTEIPEFALGSRTFHIQIAPLVEAENLGGVDGILGLDSLQEQRVLIDFRKQRILVDDAKRLGGNGGYEIVVKARRELGQLIITGARINGIATDVIIDTGSQVSIGNLSLLERLSRSRSMGETTMTDVNGQDLTAAIRIGRNIEIGRMQLNQIPIVFADAAPFKALGMADRPALILGMHELSLFQRVAIDFETRKVLFDLPASASFGGVSVSQR